MYEDGDNVLLIIGDKELSHSASSWRPGEPFPLPEGPGADRYRALLETHRVDTWPRIDTTERRGTVITTGDSGAYWPGLLLAKATHRAHRHVESPLSLPAAIRSVRDEPVAVVGLAAELSVVGDWIGMAAPRAGIVTARDVASLVCLVYRTLTVDSLAERQDFVVMHPADAEADLADAVAFDEFGRLGRDGARVLAIRTHGVECSANLPDGVLCGRSDHLDVPLPRTADKARFVSCLQGAGCYRRDLHESQRLSAADLNASFVFLESCVSISVGSNALPTDIGLGLGFLSGTAVAVVGALGLHLPDPAFLHVFTSLVRQGLSLGEAVETLNQHALAIGGELSRFGLLGDPTLVVAPRTEARQDHSLATGNSVVDAASISTSPYVEGLAEVVQLNETLSRLQQLQWLGIEMPEAELWDMRREIRAATMKSSPHIGEKQVAELRQRIGAVQSLIIDQQVDQMHRNWWHFAEGFLPRFRQVTTVPAECALCGGDSAFIGTFSHRVEAGLTIKTLHCRRCSDIWWSVGEPAVRLVSPQAHWLARDQAAELTAQLTNPTGQPLSGAIGFGSLAGWRTGLPVGWSRELTLEPRTTQEIAWIMDISSTAQVHEHKSAFVSLLDGFYSAWVYRLYVTGQGRRRPDQPPAEPRDAGDFAQEADG
ncbi:hypothetical protein ACWDRB_55030 [Nonomuraea sp. NPDC003707]